MRRLPTMRLLTRIRRRPSIDIDETRRSLAWFNANAGLRLWYDNIAGITGFIFVGYALALGVDKDKIGYLASIASLACLVQLAGLLAANSIRDKKRVAILVGYLEPAIYMGMVVAVYFAPHALKLPVIGLGILLSATFLTIIPCILGTRMYPGKGQSKSANQAAVKENTQFNER